MMKCRQKARQWVRLAAAGSVPLTLVPLPGFTTPSLAAVEVALIYQVAKIYGVNLSQLDLTVLAGTLGVGSVAVRMGVVELVGLVPLAGWVVKALAAQVAVRGIGALAIRHLEDRFPDREFTVSPAALSLQDAKTVAKAVDDGRAKGP